MKHFLLLFIFIPGILFAQPAFKFDKRFIDAENKWVILAPNKDSSYGYGFVYLDIQAGLTLNLEGKFTITKEGKLIPQKIENAMMKYRLQPTRTLIALVPTDKFGELQIPTVPDWLSIYQKDGDSPQRLYRLGFTYNAWNECEKALDYLEKLEKINSDFTGLAVELSYSYNCLEKFEKAISVLENALNKSPNNCYYYKELAYAYQHKGDMQKALSAAETGIAKCDDNTTKGEIAYNIAYSFYLAKDKANLHKWVEEAKKWITTEQQYLKALNQMEAELNK